MRYRSPTPRTLRHLLCAACVIGALWAGGFLSGCAANPEGWRADPVATPLPAVFVYVDREEPGRRCAHAGSWGCAVRDYTAGVCRIYIEASAAPWQRTHELAHCAGYSHP